MKVIGLLGGMSWESSIVYYRLINEAVRARFGGLVSARCVMESVNFAEIAALQKAGDWRTLTALLSKSAKNLQRAGAEFLVICTNTMHCIAEEVAAAAELPLIHIADATGAEIVNQRVSRVGLLGTKFTMEMDFYRKRLQESYGIEVLVPKSVDRDIIHTGIFEELCRGIINQRTKEQYVRIINDFSAAGAEGVVLGCTEIPLLVGTRDVSIALFDTTAIHAKAATLASFGELSISCANALSRPIQAGGVYKAIR